MRLFVGAIAALLLTGSVDTVAEEATKQEAPDKSPEKVLKEELIALIGKNMHPFYDRFLDAEKGEDESNLSRWGVDFKFGVGDFERAQEAYSTFRKTPNEETREKALALYGDALNNFILSLKLFPYSADTHNYIGLCCIYQENYGLALKALNGATQLSSRPVYFYNRANVREIIGRTFEGGNNLLKVVRLYQSAKEDYEYCIRQGVKVEHSKERIDVINTILLRSPSAKK